MTKKKSISIVTSIILSLACDVAEGNSGAGGHSGGTGGSDATTASESTGGAGACVVGAEETGTFLQTGYCYAHAPTCWSDQDCPSSYNGCDPDWQRCRAWTECHCASDTDCPEGAHCVRNERVCGICQPNKAGCTGDHECPNVGEICWRNTCIDTCVVDCRCGAEVISFTQEEGCLNDGSVEFCVPKDNEALVDWIGTIAPEVTCIEGRGRARCDKSTEWLCQYPTTRVECVTGSHTLADQAWRELCEIASLPAVRAIVPTFYE